MIHFVMSQGALTSLWGATVPSYLPTFLVPWVLALKQYAKTQCFLSPDCKRQAKYLLFFGDPVSFEGVFVVSGDSAGVSDLKKRSKIGHNIAFLNVLTLCYESEDKSFDQVTQLPASHSLTHWFPSTAHPTLWYPCPPKHSFICGSVVLR